MLAEVDHERRTAIRAHHSATHLLHEALRRQLGEHVTQKGSLNAPDRLRFDICQPTPISRDELAWVEREVNARIRENSEVTTRLMTPDEAVAEGAMALFGEKYGDEVRVVVDGRRAPATARPTRSSCAAARMCAAPAISACSASPARARSAPGVRRIEAVAGAAALAAVAEADRRLAEAAARCAPARPKCRSVWPRWSRIGGGWSGRWPSCRRSSPPAAVRPKSKRSAASASPRATSATCRRAT